MLTRCPHCRTIFRVTAEQMKARAGLVRCGRCHTAFDALQMLIEGEDERRTKSSAASSLAAPTATFETPPAHGTAQASRFAPSEMPEDALPASSSSGESMTDPCLAAVGEHVSVERTSLHLVREEVAAEPSESTAAPLEESTARREPVLEATELQAPSPEPSEPERCAAEAKIDEELIRPPSDTLENFLQEPSPPRRWPWLLGSLLALLVLLGQALLAFRVDLAVRYPQTKPLLRQLCAWVGCELPLPRRSELLSIEASNLHPGAAGRLELVTTLRNRATFAQQYPHLEVTLTDAADRPVVRRVFAPAEWLPAGTDPAAGFAAQSEMTVELTLLAHALDPAGYRLYIFHP